MTTPTHITLDELDREGALVGISDAHAQALAATELVVARAERSGWRLLPNEKVGSVRIGDLQAEVQPKGKVKLTGLLFLLGYARDPGFRPEDVQAFGDEDLWPALAETLARLPGQRSAPACCRATGHSTSRCAPCGEGCGLGTRSRAGPGR